MLIFRSNIRTNVIRSLMFPFIILFFFGGLGSSIRSVPVAIANYANNQQSMRFISALQNGAILQIKAVTNQEAGMSMLHNGSVVLLIVILPTFPGGSSNSPSIHVYYASSQFTQIGAALPFIQSAASKFNQNPGIVEASQQLGSNIVSTPTSGTSASYRDFLASSVILMSVAFGAIFGGGMSIIIDRQLGMIKAFLITPINKNAIMLGKLMSGTVQAMTYGILALLMAMLLFGLRIAMGPLGLVWIVLITFLVALSFSSLAIVLGSRIGTIEVYAIVSQMTIMPAWFLSGGFFPTTAFPSFLKPFSQIDPLTYATIGIRSVVLNGYYLLSDVTMDLGVLIAFCMITIIIGFKLFKNTIE